MTDQTSAPAPANLDDVLKSVTASIASLAERVAAIEAALVKIAQDAENVVLPEVSAVMADLGPKLLELERFAAAEGSSLVQVVRELGTRTLGLFHHAPPLGSTINPPAATGTDKPVS